jgi:hypothetical protein
MDLDTVEMSRFIELLTGDASTPVHWQTLKDGDRGTKKGLARTWYGTLAQSAKLLQRLSDEGAGIFVTVSETDGQGRQKGNIMRARAIWADIDHPVERRATPDYPLRPTIEVHSSGDDSSSKRHVYWVLEGGAPAKVIEEYCKRAALAVDGDQKATDRSRVLRCPGTWHQKGEPRLVRIRDVGPRVTLEQLDAALPRLPESTRSKRAPARSRSAWDAPDSPERIMERASRYLARCKPSISGQDGHSRLLAATTAMVIGFDLSDADAKHLLMSEFNPRCVPPWREKDIDHKVKQARENRLGKPKASLLILESSTRQSIAHGISQ